MNENIRISDADRERVVERLREHYAEGRLTADELEERVTTALSAKTFGDLRGLMTDLPEPETVGAAGPMGPQGPIGWQSPPPWFAAGRPIVAYRRGPRILPLLLIVLAVSLLAGGGWAFVAFLKVVLVFWLVTCLLGIFAAGRFRRHARRYWNQGQGQPGQGGPWQHYSWRR
jgi:hypothetical protein